jgi:DNA-binding transcriptional regulator YiaG
MTNTRTLIQQARLTQAGFARFLGVDPRAVRRWVTVDGKHPISPPALLWLRLAAEQPELFQQVRELLKGETPNGF